MATQPNTVVTFRSPVALEGVTAALGLPFSVTLTAGETYLPTTKVINNGSNTENKSISGILVTSDQPIVVNSGSQHNYQPYSGNRDAGIDQFNWCRFARRVRITWLFTARTKPATPITSSW